MNLSLFDLGLAGEPVPSTPQIAMRPYQEEALQRIEGSMDLSGARDLLVLPTGCGKTSVFSELIRRRNLRRRTSALVVAHRVELLEQGADRIQAMNPGLQVGIESGDLRAPWGCDVVVAGIQSLARGSRLDWFKPRLVIVDEAHHAAASSYQSVLTRFGAYEGLCYVLGVTATPHRLDNKALYGDHRRAIFERVIYSYPLRQAISDGWLCPPSGYRVAAQFDLSKVKTSAGDFNAGELQAVVDNQDANWLAYQSWSRTSADRQTIVFCAGVEHARHVADAFRAQGVRAGTVNGAMPADERARVMAKFRSGALQVLTNMEIVTEGVDVPSVSCVLMLRPTQSWALYTQMVGRGLRLAPGKKDCVVIDVVGNSESHSLASLPAILGLPPRMDLQGQSAMRALERYDGLSDAQRGALFARQTTFEGLNAELTAVDLLAELAIPEEVVEVSAFAWMKTGDDQYRLDCGGGRSASLCCDTLGGWRLQLRSALGEVSDQELGDDRRLAFREADMVLRREYPGIDALGRNARWRSDPPTDKQLKALAWLRVSKDVVGGLDKGSASQLITKLLAEREAKKQGGRAR